MRGNIFLKNEINTISMKVVAQPTDKQRIKKTEGSKRVHSLSTLLHSLSTLCTVFCILRPLFVHSLSSFFAPFLQKGVNFSCIVRCKRGLRHTRQNLCYEKSICVI